ncbi:MAG TPA: hypothetical protein VGB83_05695 [Actinomycetota bacterium]
MSESSAASGSPGFSFQPGASPECMACPFGLMFFAMRHTKPEALEHLMKAGYELFLAAKVFMDAAAERWEHAQGSTLQHIPID